MNPANYLKIKSKIPSNVKILAVSKGFKSQEIKTIQNIGQNDFGESKVQEALEKQLTLKAVSYTHLTLPTILRV